MARPIHAVRDASGAIVSLASSAQDGSELLESDHPEILLFLDAASGRSGFSTSDAQFVRVLEDLIDTLIEKGVIRHTDLPGAAQQKLLSRKGMRHSLKGALNPLVDDHGLV
jgi:hypothetical protein